MLTRTMLSVPFGRPPCAFCSRAFSAPDGEQLKRRDWHASGHVGVATLPGSSANERRLDRRDTPNLAARLQSACRAWPDHGAIARAARRQAPLKSRSLGTQELKASSHALPCFASAANERWTAVSNAAHRQRPVEICRPNQAKSACLLDRGTGKGRQAEAVFGQGRRGSESRLSMPRGTSAWSQQ